MTKNHSYADSRVSTARVSSKGRFDNHAKPRAEPAKPRAEPAKPRAEPAKPRAEHAKPRDVGAKLRFDVGGVRKAVIALLAVMHRSGRHGTIPDALIALEVVDALLDGRPHSMRSLSAKLGIPYTSVSRIVYSLTSDAEPGGFLRLASDTRDRRRKHIELDPDFAKRIAPHMRALEKAMVDYYGDSALKLKRKAG